MRGRTSAIGLAVVALALMACAPTFQTRRTDVRVALERLVVLPPFVQDVLVDAQDEPTPDLATAAATEAAVRGALRRFAVAHGARVLETPDLASYPSAAHETFNAFYRWAQRTIAGTAAQITGRHDFHLRSVADWHLEEDPAPIAATLRAETALLVVVSNTRRTFGRQLQGLVGAYTPWRALCAACLFSLTDGRPIWCDARADAWDELRDPVTAAAAVREILNGLDATMTLTARR
ncbi:MAG TPA: hypothetical protein VKZ18_04140 [Polyangia bacterium]|nr:hypothetical protein [Polyangia bacterium]